MNLYQVRKKFIEKELINTTPQDLINIINDYDKDQEATQYIRVSVNYNLIDKYSKIHYQITEPEDIKFMANFNNGMVEKLKKMVDGHINNPIKYHRPNSILGFQASIPQQEGDDIYDKILNSATFKGQMKIIFRVGEYLGTKYGSGYYLHIIKPYSKERQHKYKKLSTPLTPYTYHKFINY